MSARKRIDPGWTWDDNFNMSQAIEIGNAIYVSGQVAMDPSGNGVGPGDMKAQTRQALQNVKTVLESAGASMEDVAKITVYMTDISLLRDTHEVRAEFFPDPPPASTGIEVSALAFPGLLIEIEAIAVKS